MTKKSQTENYMNRFFLMFLLPVVMLATSCSKKIANLDKYDRGKKVEVREIDFNYFESKTKVRYQEGEQKLNGNATIRIKKDSLIWFSVSPSVGIEITRAVITPDTIIVMNRLEKEFYTFNFKTLSDYFNFKIDYNLVQSVLLGNLPVEFENDDEIEKSGDYYKISRKKGFLSIDSYVQNQTKKLETVIMKEVFGKNQLSLKYGDFGELNEYLFPNSCQVNLTYDTPKGPVVTSVDIEHSKAEISDKALRFPFNIPSRYVHK